MAIQLRILSGARAGQTESFEKSVISVGRHPECDLKFDATSDLDVSARHAEIHANNGRYAVVDAGSTNGTFVNGHRVDGAQELRDADVIGFGAHGPTVAVRIGEVAAARRPTTERVAVAVQEQTRALKTLVAAAIVVLGALAVGGYWMGHREAAQRDAQIKQLIAASEQLSRDFQARLQASDAASIEDLRRRNDSLQTLVRSTGGAATARQALEIDHQRQRELVNFAPGLRQANDGAIALITSEVGGQAYEATGFGVRPSGLIVTNRHVVYDKGQRASHVTLKFANTRESLPARIVAMSSDSAVDLAVLQIERPGTYPSVKSVSVGGVDTQVGSTVVTLGFPSGSDTPMEGSGADLTPKTTLTAGMISKSIPGTLQIDSFAGQGSSGSPVLDLHGHVIGVVWGGLKGSGGKIVYAVPGDAVTAMINAVR